MTARGFAAFSLVWLLIFGLVANAAWPPPSTIVSLMDHGITTTATIDDIRVSRRTYEANYSYMVGTAPCAGTTTSIYRVGQQIKVVYLPESPTVSMDARAVTVLPTYLFLSFWGIAFLTGFGFALRSFLRGSGPTDPPDQDEIEESFAGQPWEGNPNDPAWKDESSVG